VERREGEPRGPPLDSASDDRAGEGSRVRGEILSFFYSKNWRAFRTGPRGPTPTPRSPEEVFVVPTPRRGPAAAVRYQRWRKAGSSRRKAQMHDRSGEKKATRAPKCIAIKDKLHISLCDFNT
jgi:hypothetical protein